MTSIEVKDLVKHYRSKGKPTVEAVNGVSFSVQGGECFGLLGPNGAGKSTTINCLTGFFPPTSGQVRLNGIDVNSRPRSARSQLGVCAQEDTLDTDFEVLDQLVQHGTYYGMSYPDSKARALELLAHFSIADKARLPVEALSGGMRRRLQVARAMISTPAILVLDEPTTGLDPEARRALWEIIEQQRRRGAAILLSTHYMEEAQRLCDRIGILSGGKILDIAPPAALIKKHVGENEVTEEVRPGLTIKRATNLEDVYLRLTGNTLEQPR